LVLPPPMACASQLPRAGSPYGELLTWAMGDSSERHDVEDEAGRRGLSAGGAMDQIEDEMEALALSSSVARKAAAAERQAKQATLLSTAIEQAFPVPAPRSVSGGRAQITDAYGRRACAKVEHVIIGGEGVTLAFVAVPASNTASSAAAKETERRLAHAILVWCSKHVARLVVAGAEEDGSGKSLRRAGRSFFKEAQATALRDHPKLAKCAAACTLVLCAVNHSRGEVTTCHLGTCVAVLASRTAFGQRASPPTLLSRNHRVQDCAAERARVEKSGGCLAHTASQDGQPRGPLLIWPGGHETARCIGSLGKGSRAQLPLPSCATVPLPPEEVELLLGSASVLDEIHVSSALALLRRAPSAQMAAQLLVEAVAVQRHSYGPATDNDAGALRPRTVIACAVLKVGCPPPGQPASALKPSALHGRSRWSPLRPRAGCTELGSPTSSGVSTPPPASASPPPSRIVSADLQVAEPTVLRVPIDDNNSRHGGSPPPAHSLFSWRPFRSQQA